MLVTEATKSRAQDALDYLRTYPERHNQGSWIDGEFTYDDKGNCIVTEENLCNTTMCVAGTVMFQTDGYIKYNLVALRAAELLGLDDREAGTLFFNTYDDDAIDLLTAIANGDSEKFSHIAEGVEERYLAENPEETED